MALRGKKGSRGGLRPFVQHGARLRPVGCDHLTAYDLHAGQDAEKIATTESVAEVLAVTISESGVGQRPDGRIDAPAVKAVADRDRPLAVERIRSPEDMSDVFNEEAVPVFGLEFRTERPRFSILDDECALIRPMRPALLTHRHVQHVKHLSRELIPV